MVFRWGGGGGGCRGSYHSFSNFVFIQKLWNFKVENALFSIATDWFGVGGGGGGGKEMACLGYRTNRPRITGIFYKN